MVGKKDSIPNGGNGGGGGLERHDRSMKDGRGHVLRGSWDSRGACFSPPFLLLVVPLYSTVPSHLFHVHTILLPPLVPLLAHHTPLPLDSTRATFSS